MSVNAALQRLLDLARDDGLAVRVRGPRAELRADGRLVAVIEDPAPDLCTTTEAGDLLGVSRQRVLQLHADHADFPEPVRRGRGYAWSRTALQRWARTHHRDAREAS